MDLKNLFQDGTSDDTFFKKHFNNLMSVMGKDVLQEFKKMKSDEERIRFVDKKVIPQLKIEWVENGKDSGAAQELKERGNQVFAKGNDREALKLYTESLMKMPQGRCIQTHNPTFSCRVLMLIMI